MYITEAKGQHVNELRKLSCLYEQLDLGDPKRQSYQIWYKYVLLVYAVEVYIIIRLYLVASVILKLTY